MEQKYKYLACARCSTFNQAKFIEDTMNGFTMQQTSFPFVCFIIDDASTDGEPEVIKNYLKEHFHEPYRTEETEYANIICANHKTNNNCAFVVLLLKYNHYSINKRKLPYLREWVEHIKYQALCEGDDYWVDDNKLQRQVEYMEKHEECTLCYSKANCFNQSHKQFVGTIGHEMKGFYDLLMRGNSIPTLTTLFRQSHITEYYDKVYMDQWLMGDYPLWLFLSSKGDLHFEAKETAVYRILESSASHFKTYESHKRFEDSVYNIRCLFADKCGVSKEDRNYIDNEYYKRLFNLAFEHNEYKTARDLFYRIKKKDVKIVVKYILSFIL